MSALLDAVVLAQSGLLSLTQHRATVASLRRDSDTANERQLTPALKIGKGIFQTAGIVHLADFVTHIVETQGTSPSLVWAAKLAAALISFQSAQLVNSKTDVVTASCAVSSALSIARLAMGSNHVYTHAAAAALDLAALAALFKRFVHARRGPSIALTEDLRQLALSYEKDLAAEDGHAVDEKPIVFKGYAVMSTETWKDFKLIDFTPKKIADYDVEIAIKYCGVCASDVHTITGGWRKNIVLPMITGHEIVGHVKRVGPKVTKFKPGDRVGVGAQSDSCQDCDRCHNNNEQYCFNSTSTYNSYHLTGEISHGGYATGKVANELFVFPIPDELPLKQAASMCCGGLTVFSPLKRYGAGPGKKVAVIGIGGLGHYALQFAAAMDCDEVIAISHTAGKKEDAFKMGATRFVATAEEGLEKSGLKDIDIIISTIDVNTAIPVKELCAIMSVGGALVSVGLPDGKVPLGIGDLSVSASNLTCTNIGSKAEAIEMFDLAVKKGVRTWIQEYDMKDCSLAVQALHGDLPGTQVRYRQVLKMDIDY